jgi:hypothetical protein
MPWHLFETCLNKVPRDVDVHFSGYGEPWHHPECTRMVVEAHRAGHKVAVFTTAFGLSPDDVPLLAKVPFKRFSVHLPDGKQLMRSRIDEAYLETLVKLRRSNLMNIDFFSIGPAHPDVTEAIGDVAETRDVTSRAENVVRQEGIGLRWLNAPGAMDAIVCRKDRIFQNVLLPSGHVALCCMDYGLEHILGNLLDTDYHALHRSETFVEILKKTTTGGDGILCGRCEYAVPGRYSWE